MHINDIFQDQKGYLWTGGYGGLSCFDGFTFRNYGPSNGLVNFSVQVITQDYQGNLIIGTTQGLSIWENPNPGRAQTTFINYTKTNGLLNEHINSLMSYKNRVLIGTDSGLYYLSNHKITPEPQLAGKEVRKIIKGHGNLIIVTPHRIYTMEGQKIQPLFHFGNQYDTIFNTALIDSEHRLWVGTNIGLFKLEPNAGPSMLQIVVGSEGKEITSLFSDKTNSIWAGTHQKLLHLYENKIKDYRIGREINSNDIMSITSDYEQNIWIGTQGGLFKFRDEGFASFGSEDGIGSTMIYPVVNDSAGKIWFGTDRGGMYSYDGKTFHNFGIANGLPGNTVRGLQFDTLGRLWIGTEKGLGILEGNHIRTIESTKNIFIQTIYVDKKMNLWIGHDRGLAILHNIMAKTPQLEQVQLPGNQEAIDHFVTAFQENENGGMWMASFVKGLLYWDGKTIKNVTEEFNIQTHSATDVLLDKSQHLFVASMDGLYAIDLRNHKTIRVSEKDGLNSSLVYSLMLSEEEKTLWVGTNQGVNKLNISSIFSGKKLQVLSFGKMEGFEGVECNTGGICREKDGSLWFGTVDGLIKYNPVKYLENIQAPMLNFTGFKLSYNDTALPPNPVLSHNQNNITFQFQGICLTNPEKIKYSHRLLGFEAKWSPSGIQNYVAYSNLPPGDYTFSVRCCNNQGIWSKSPLLFSFKVLPALWQRWWFILIEFCTLLLGTIIIVQIRIRQIKKIQGRESKIQIEMVRNELKALRAQMNPHFLFNSLNSIQNFIVNRKEDDAIFYLNRFAKLMRMILNNSEKSMVSIGEEMEALTIYLDLEKMRFEGKFEYHIELDKNIDPEFEMIPTMLIQPFVENAILHGLVTKPSQGNISIHIFNKNNGIVATIADDGIGREKAMKINKDGHKGHRSMGMKITQDRLKLLSDAHQSPIAFSITDLKDNKGEGCGTLVELSWNSQAE